MENKLKQPIEKQNNDFLFVGADKVTTNCIEKQLKQTQRDDSEE